MIIAERHHPLLLLLLALLINGVALALSQNYLDGDAHTRTYMALRWLDNPFFITRPNDISWVFGPLHCYLNAAALQVYNSPTLTPRLLSLLLTSLTVFPIYYSVKIAFGSRQAFYTTLLFCFYTLFIHPAAIAASEGINLLLIFLGIWFFLRFRRGEFWVDLALSALSLSAATAMRYESWVMAPFLTIILLWRSKSGVASGAESGGRQRLSRAALFGLVSHGFILMWLFSCWQQWGDPLYFLHYSGNLDAPLIAKRIEESGTLRFMAYNLAFLPAVMLASFPVTTLLTAAVGFSRTLRRERGNLFILLFALYVVLHLVLFVFSLQRYPLARFTTLPGAFFLIFAGSGVVYLKGCLRPLSGKLLVLFLVAVAAANTAILGFFSRPSANDIEEKLRAVSPVTQQPYYFDQAFAYCDSLLSEDGELVLDARNYNDRLLYLSLYHHRDKIYHRWRDNDQLRLFIDLYRPQYLIHTDYPRNNHELFSFAADSSAATVAGVRYRKLIRIGIFQVLERGRRD